MLSQSYVTRASNIYMYIFFNFKSPEKFVLYRLRNEATLRFVVVFPINQYNIESDKKIHPLNYRVIWIFIAFFVPRKIQLFSRTWQLYEKLSRKHSWLRQAAWELHRAKKGRKEIVGVLNSSQSYLCNTTFVPFLRVSGETANRSFEV